MRRWTGSSKTTRRADEDLPPEVQDRINRTKPADFAPGLFASVVILISIAVYIIFMANCADAKTIFWLHHSVGRNLINDGSIRPLLADHDLYDHDYNYGCGDYCGLRLPDGSYAGYDFSIPGNGECGDTNPQGLHTLLTTPSTARDLCLAYDIAVFKSCFTASDITSDAQLVQYKAFYSDICTTLQSIESQTMVFVLLSPPPRHRLATSAAAAARARQFADWMASLAGGRIVYLDLFDELAGSDNYLRYEYEIWHAYADSHPNTTANQIVGATIADFLNDVATSGTGVSEPSPARETWGSIKAAYSHRKD